MSAEPEVLRYPDADAVADAVADQLADALFEAQSARGKASVVLTGGSLGIAVLRSLARSPQCHDVDWSCVELWWGDERFLPSGDPDRNETQARAALLDRLPLKPDQLHPMGASDGPDGDDAEAAAARYAELLSRASGDDTNADSGAPAFDVLLLGMGPDGHIASLFPGHDGVKDDRTALPVFDSPKPPRTRISLGLRAIHGARQVWLVIAGADKAAPAAAALAGADVSLTPAAGARGTERTVFFLDEAAAAQL